METIIKQTTNLFVIAIVGQTSYKQKKNRDNQY